MWKMLWCDATRCMPEYGRWYQVTRIDKGADRVVVVIVFYVHAELLNRYIGYLFATHCRTV